MKKDKNTAENAEVFGRGCANVYP